LKEKILKLPSIAAVFAGNPSNNSLLHIRDPWGGGDTWKSGFTEYAGY
jgi:hypothetical protein